MSKESKITIWWSIIGVSLFCFNGLLVPYGRKSAPLEGPSNNWRDLLLSEPVDTEKIIQLVANNWRNKIDCKTAVSVSKTLKVLSSVENGNIAAWLEEKSVSIFERNSMSTGGAIAAAFATLLLGMMFAGMFYDSMYCPGLD